MCDRLRSIPRFVWLLGFIGYFVFVLLRMTVYSDYSFQEQKRLENVALPTADQLNSLFSGRVPAPSAQPAKK